MSNKYSELRFGWKKVFSVDEFMNKVWPMKTMRNGDYETFAKAYSLAGGAKNAFTMDWMILNGEVEHFFLETKELLNFLTEAPIKELSFTRFASKNWADRVNIGRFVTHGPARLIVLHHQNPTLPSVKVLYQLMNPGTDQAAFYVYIEDGDTYAGFMEKPVTYDNGAKVAVVPDKFLISNLNDDDTWDLPMYRYARLALNFLLYESCFPESIRKGAPENLANQNHYRKYQDPHRVTPAPELVDPHHSTVSPHFRSGFFRCLTSEFYKNKRGQVVFVRSTFVRGSEVYTVDNSKEKQL